MKDKHKTIKFTNKITRISLLFIALCSVCLALVSKKIILTLYGYSFIESVTALVLLLPGICLFSISKILSSSLSGMGRVNQNLLISAITCVITICLDLVLIPSYGINGASIASCIGYSFSAIITLLIYCNITNSSIASVIIISKEDINDIQKRIKSIIYKN